MNLPPFQYYRWQKESNDAFRTAGNSGRAFQEMLTGVKGLEPQLIILDSIIRYAKAYERRYGHKITEEGTLFDSFSDMLNGVHNFMCYQGAIALESDSSFDSKDNGVMEIMFNKACDVCGLNRNDFT